MAKRIPGSGSVETLPSGRHRYQFYVEGVRVRGTAVATREEAIAAMAEAMGASCAA